jgi:hypothetical protein
MWCLKQKLDGTIYLTYDRYYRYTRNVPGIWELVGSKNDPLVHHCVRMNRKAGYLCCDDDEGQTRVLVLTEE